MESVLTRLQESIGTGELINIIYHGGHEPGKSRQILPIKITADKVRAKCLTTGQIKTFSIAKIELSKNDDVTYTGQQQATEPLTVDEFNDLISNCLSDLSAMGWHVLLNEQGIGLFETLKSGKPKKNPKVYFIFLINDTDQADNPLFKPYRVPGKSFKFFDKAIEEFMAQAKYFAPNKV